MGVNNFQEHRILFVHCSITTAHFAGILLFIHLSDHLYNIGIYKYIFLLCTLVIADLVKLSFTSSQLDSVYLERHELSYSSKSKKTSKTLKNIFKFILATVGITAIYYIAIVLFGAPLLTDCEKTLTLAVTLTLLTLVPASFHLGIDNALDLFIGYPSQISGPFVESIKLNIKTVLLGTWISAFVLPLDWDRPWQAWPIPCIVGALLGYFVAHFITFAKISFVNFKRKNRHSSMKSY